MVFSCLIITHLYLLTDVVVIGDHVTDAEMNDISMTLYSKIMGVLKQQDDGVFPNLSVDMLASWIEKKT